MIGVSSVNFSGKPPSKRPLSTEIANTRLLEDGGTCFRDKDDQYIQTNRAVNYGDFLSSLNRIQKSPNSNQNLLGFVKGSLKEGYDNEAFRTLSFYIKGFDPNQRYGLIIKTAQAIRPNYEEDPAKGEEINNICLALCDHLKEAIDMEKKTPKNNNALTMVKAFGTIDVISAVSSSAHFASFDKVEDRVKDIEEDLLKMSRKSK